MLDTNPVEFKTTVRCVQSDANEVESRLRECNKKISELESKATMFRNMVNSRISTKDVSNFVVKQARLKQANNRPDERTRRAAMRSKLEDVLTLLHKERRERKRLKQDLSFLLRKKRSRFKNIMVEMKATKLVKDQEENNKAKKKI